MLGYVFGVVDFDEVVFKCYYFVVMDGEELVVDF